MNNVIIKGVECSVLRFQASSRGGGIEIGLDSLGFLKMKMTAYQNYLGGGMLGRVCSDCTISNYLNYPKLKEIAEELKMVFHEITNGDDEWESLTYDENQKQCVSAY